MADETVTPEVIAAEIRETAEKKRFRKNVKIFSILVLFVLMITIIIASVSESKESSELEAWNRILQATFTAQTSDTDLSAELNKILEDGGNATDAGFYAQMLIIDHSAITYDKEKLAQARDAGSAFLKRYPQSKFADQVKVDLGTVLFNLEDYQGALGLYEEVCGSQSRYLLGEANLFKGLTLEKLGKDQEAIKTYTFIAEENNSFLGDIKEYASFARAQLESKKN